MAKPDWGALQQRFLAEHAKSGISPKEWCGLQGLNYATAKRYIKTANSQKGTAKKTANGNVRKIAQRPPVSCVTPSGEANNSQNDPQEMPGTLKSQHESFAQNIAQGMTQKDAAICAGYSPSNAESQSVTLIRRPDVRRRIN